VGRGRTGACFAQGAAGAWVRDAYIIPERWQRVFVLINGTAGRGDGGIVHRRAIRGGLDGVLSLVTLVVFCMSYDDIGKVK